MQRLAVFTMYFEYTSLLSVWKLSGSVLIFNKLQLAKWLNWNFLLHVYICQIVSMTEMTDVIFVFLKTNLLYIKFFLFLLCRSVFKFNVGRYLYTCKLWNVSVWQDGVTRAWKAEFSGRNTEGTVQFCFASKCHPLVVCVKSAKVSGCVLY